MPDNLSFRRVMTEKVEDVAVVLFLPLFFVFTGLRTEIGLLNTPHLWGVCALIHRDVDRRQIARPLRCQARGRRRVVEGQPVRSAC